MKSSFLALIAAAGLVGATATAQAADLGGDCCADLEERVAELEATTARKGNRKVKLTVSGHINESILFFDDGVESNIYQVTNEISRSRFRFVGDAKINAEWSAGYLLEIGVRSSRQDRTTANTDDGGAELDIRHSAWWINNKNLGKVWVGQTSSATDGITEINLANVGHFHSSSIFDFNGGFAVRQAGTGANIVTARNLGINDDGFIGEGTRFNIVKYETPAIAGFSLSAAAGEDDFWDVALRYAGEFSGFKLAFGVGYQQQTDGAAGVGSQCANLDAVSTDTKCSSFGASASVMHVPTGLFVFGAYGTGDDDRKKQVNAAFDDRDENWMVMAGIEQNWFGIGKTTLYGEYLQGDLGTPFNGAAARTFGGNAILNSEVTVWGLGFNQQITAAAMDLYVMYRHYEYDINTTAGAIAAEDFQAVQAGGIIRF